MNIYQKLIEVRKAVPYLQKDNKGHQFNYVSSSQTLGSVRAKMDELGVLLMPEVQRYEVKDHVTSKGAHWYLTILDMKFTWVNADNPEEKIACGWTGQGLDDGEKGVGKALTYAEKYFMLKFFNIATDMDDPDSFQKETTKKATRPPDAIPQENDPHETKVYDMHPAEPKDVASSLGDEIPNPQEAIDDLKKALSDMMSRAGIRTKDSKKDFFNWFMCGRDLSVDNLLDFKDNFMQWKGEYLKAKEQA